MAKNSFSIHFTSKFVLFQVRTKSLCRQKNILSGQMDEALDTKNRTKYWKSWSYTQEKKRLLKIMDALLGHLKSSCLVKFPFVPKYILSRLLTKNFVTSFNLFLIPHSLFYQVHKSAQNTLLLLIKTEPVSCQKKTH